MDKETKFEINLILYLASLIFGAGILTLPYASVYVGFPTFVIVLILITAMYTTFYKFTVNEFYTNTSELVKDTVNEINPALKNVFRKEDTYFQLQSFIIRKRIKRAKGGLLYQLLKEAGQSKVLMITTLSMLFFSLSLSLAYTIVGGISLIILAQFLKTYLQNIQALVVLLIAVGILTLIFNSLLILIGIGKWGVFERIAAKPIYTALVMILSMVGLWFIFIAILVFVPQLSFLGYIFFVFAVLGAKISEAVLTSKAERVGRKEMFSLYPSHDASAKLAIFEVIILLAGVFIAFLTLLENNQALLENITYIPKLSPTEFISKIALTITIIFFALSGVFYDVVSYPEIYISERKFRPHMVTVFVSLIYLIFTFMIISSIPINLLIEADRASQHAIIPLSQMVSGSIALIVIILSYGYALIAVSNAYRGYMDSFIDSISPSLGVRGELKKYALWITIALGIVAFLLFLNASGIKIALSTLIGAIGAISTGLYVLGPPLMIGEKNRKRVALYIFVVICSILLAVLTVVPL